VANCLYNSLEENYARSHNTTKKKRDFGKNSHELMRIAIIGRAIQIIGSDTSFSHSTFRMGGVGLVM
jgi:hypothetical protein